MDGRWQILNQKITWSPTRVKHGWLCLAAACTVKQLCSGFYYELTQQSGHNKVIRKVIWSWAHLSSPVSVFIPTLVLSLKSPDRGPTRQKTGKTRMESPNMGTSNCFFSPRGCLPFRPLAIGYQLDYLLLTIGNCLLAIENWVLVMAIGYWLTNIDFWLLTYGYWLLAIG